MTLERVSAFITYCIAVLLAWLGDMSLKDASTVGGVVQREGNRCVGNDAGHGAVS